MRKLIALFVLLSLFAAGVSAQKNGDVNGDGKVNVADVVNVTNQILKVPGSGKTATDVVDIVNLIFKEGSNASPDMVFTTISDNNQKGQV